MLKSSKKDSAKKTKQALKERLERDKKDALKIRLFALQTQKNKHKNPLEDDSFTKKPRKKRATRNVDKLVQEKWENEQDAADRRDQLEREKLEFEWQKHADEQEYRARLAEIELEKMKFQERILELKTRIKEIKQAGSRE